MQEALLLDGRGEDFDLHIEDVQPREKARRGEGERLPNLLVGAIHPLPDAV